MATYDRSSRQTKIDWDIRYFRRYQKEVSFNLKIKNRIFEAKTVDYCPIGVGIVITNPAARLNKGDPIDIDIKELDLHEQARAAWIQEIPSGVTITGEEVPSGIRVGVERIDLLKGRFNLYPLSDLLIGLHRTLRTGVLEVSYHSLKERVFIDNGNIISAESNYEKDRLIDVLFKARKIDREQYDKAEEMHIKTGNNYPAILVQMGYVKPQDLRCALRLQARRIITRLFLMRDAEFEFSERPFRLGEVVTLRLSIADLVYRYVKKHAQVELLETYLLDSVVYYSSNPLNLFQNIHLGYFESTVLSYVNGKRNIGDIVRLSASPGRPNPLKIIFALLEARFLRIVEEHRIPPGRHPHTVADDKEKERDIFEREIERLHLNYRNLDYYGVIGVSPNSTAEEIKKAYYGAAQKFHPDKHSGLPEDLKDRLTEIFTYVTNAYLALTNRQRRKEYDLALLNKGDFLHMGDSPDAEGHARSQNNMEFQPHSSQLENSHKAKQHFAEGMTAYRVKKFGEAADSFVTAIYFDSSVAKYHYYYGCALLALDNPRKAVEALAKADDLQPLDPSVLAELGHAYLRLNFPLRAKSHFDKAANLSPSNARALEGISILNKKKTG